MLNPVLDAALDFRVYVVSMESSQLEGGGRDVCFAGSHHSVDFVRKTCAAMSLHMWCVQFDGKAVWYLQNNVTPESKFSLRQSMWCVPDAVVIWNHVF